MFSLLVCVCVSMILFLTECARALESVGRGLVGAELSVEELQRAMEGLVGDPHGAVGVHRHAKRTVELVHGSAAYARHEVRLAEHALGCRSSRPSRAVHEPRFRFGFRFFLLFLGRSSN